MSRPYRLPDLPNAGYSTTRQREASDAMMICLRALERDRLALLMIVFEGREKWRGLARKAYGTLLSHDEIEEMYQVMSAWAGENVLGQMTAILADRMRTPTERVWNVAPERSKAEADALIRDRLAMIEGGKVIPHG